MNTSTFGRKRCSIRRSAALGLLSLALTSVASAQEPDTDHDGFADNVDSNPVSRAWVPWGRPDCVQSNHIVYPWPSWMLSASKDGGDWDTNQPAWVVSADDTNVAALRMEVDRSLLTNNLRMTLGYLDTSNTVLAVDLQDEQGGLVATNVADVALQGSGLALMTTLNIPMAAHTNAATLRLSRAGGAARVTCSLLYVDEDGDGLDADQEAQLGTSDYLIDSDGDGFADGVEALLYHTDPASADSYPMAAVEGNILYPGVQSGPIHALATTAAFAWQSPLYSTIPMPGAYWLGSLPLYRPLYVKAFRDHNENGVRDAWEAQGVYPGNPFALTGDAGGVNILLADPDTDGDGLSDWLELQFGTDPAVADDFPGLPFVERFESDTTTPGELHGQNKWTAFGAMVQTNVFAEGAQAMELLGLNGLATARRLFVSEAANRVWVDGHLKVLPGAEPQPPFNASAALYFNQDRQAVVYDGAAAAWAPLTNTPTLAVGEWARLTLGLDYAARSWEISINGRRLAANLGFAVPADRFTAFTMQGYAGFLDNLSISTQIPPDLDLDTDELPDAWEIEHFGSTNQGADDDADGDGLSNMEEYQRTTNPTAADTDGDGLDDGLELLLGGNPLVPDFASANLPFTENFETDTVHMGPLSGQNGWSANPADAARVQDVMVYQGAQALELIASPDQTVTVGRPITETNAATIWLDFRMPAIRTGAPGVMPDVSAAFFFDATGQLNVYDGHLPGWSVLANGGTAHPSTWARITLKLDYANQSWAIALDSRVLVDGLGFVSPCAGPQAFWLTGRRGGLDQLSVKTDAPEDLSFDDDFLPDNWEMEHFGNLDQGDHEDPDGDGLDNLAEYRAGTDPDNPDTDGDGLRDGQEVAVGLNPLLDDISTATQDTDQDGMTDVWEIAYGFDPWRSADAVEDSDGDGLSNLAEFRAGTDPHLADTDGDGVNDFLAVHVFRVDPFASFFTGGRTTNTIVSGNAGVVVAGTWSSTPEGYLRSTARNGMVEYALAVPAPGVYSAIFEVEQYNALTTQTCFDLSLEVDGLAAGREVVSAPKGSPAEAVFVTPWLEPGVHRFVLQWHNLKANTFLTIRRVMLVEFEGRDADENGVYDWFEYRQTNALSHAGIANSPVSPACFEGRAWYRDGLSVQSAAADPDEVIGIRNGPRELWFANVPLDASGLPAEIVVHDQYAFVSITQSVAWTETNLLPERESPIRIRQGDALRLMARPDGVTNGTVELHILGVTNYFTTADAPVPHAFEAAGEFNIEASWSHAGTTAQTSVVVDVIQAAFPGDPACVLGKLRKWDCPLLSPADVALENDLDTWLEQAPDEQGGSLLTIGTLTLDPRYLLARLGDDGPILDSARIIGVNADNGSYWNITGIMPDGSRIVEVQLALGNVPPDLNVQLTIFVGGVLFENGTRYLTLTAEDFDEQGVATYRFIQAPESMTSVCHTTDIFDGETRIGGN